MDRGIVGQKDGMDKCMYEQTDSQKDCGCWRDGMMKTALETNALA